MNKSVKNGQEKKPIDAKNIRTHQFMQRLAYSNKTDFA